jgi:hypothetical protein
MCALASGSGLCAVERSITSSFYGFKNYSVFRINRIILFGFIFMALRISSTEVPERSINNLQINGNGTYSYITTLRRVYSRLPLYPAGVGSQVVELTGSSSAAASGTPGTRSHRDMPPRSCRTSEKPIARSFFTPRGERTACSQMTTVGADGDIPSSVKRRSNEMS